ncbi:GntR family transcriptional regulator [Sandaracinobacter neustonicus]|uniref:GntR family transcriptional regulator n=1 Tax=Sandaracinobacter neustonicus TaxID=1715348 RepID=A0A501XMX0_9SPHN|nr:PLP-dependent aminotransferase family protein [Sandaracinobacter neustonicus]TPE61930.1 GntR family transcriptional regulator [Sandaracinobacter neustonicus]
MAHLSPFAISIASGACVVCWPHVGSTSNRIALAFDRNASDSQTMSTQISKQIGEANWLPEISGSGPIYLQLANAIARAIRLGHLKPGDRLPTQREMAEALDIDLTTVNRAVAEAQRMDLISSEGRRGSFVKDAPTVPSTLLFRDDEVRGFSREMDPGELAGIELSGLSVPPLPANAILRSAVAEGLAKLFAGDNGASLQYQPVGGGAHDRAVRATVMNRTMPTQPDQIVITPGAQSAIHAICHSVLKPGDVVACGRYAYTGFLRVARQIGVRILPVEIDEEGLVPDSIEQIARAHPLKLLFLTPFNDNPTTATMGITRVDEIARLAELHDFQMLESAPYGGLNGFRSPAVSARVPTRSWYVLTIAKSFTPALRVGFLRAPSVQAAFGVISAMQQNAAMASPLDVALDTQWLLDGTLMQMGAALAAESTERQLIAREILGDGIFRSCPAGYHLWIPRPDADSQNAASLALLAGLPVVPATIFAVEPTGREQSLRISLGGARSRDKLAADLSRLKAWLMQSL